jgi:thiamine biosynthesis lipoprotein ApbE
MIRRRDFLLSAGVVLSLPPLSAAQTPHVYQHENVLGTSLELRLLSSTPEQAETAALVEIDRLASILSSYDPSSEFSHWARTRNEAVPVSPELMEVLGLYDQWRARTNGALNPAFSAGRDADARHWHLDQANGTATHLTAAPLVLNSFTKSYIINAAADAAMRHARGAVVNIGGDLAVKGRVIEAVQIPNPVDDTENSLPYATIQAANLAVATSGSSRRGAHIIDPRTGVSPTHVLSATVVAPNATDAGALATAFTILPVSESRALAARMPGVEYLLARNGGGALHSAGWRSLLLAPAVQTPATGYEVIVNLELARIEAQRYRRPYVAVWVEDKDKFPIRTIALWLEKDRWLPELKSWYRDDRLRLLAEGNEIVASVSSATRPAGKYTLKWDGKDAKGALVKPGRYTICIEASREHGGYQILRQEIDLTAGPKQFPLTGGPEIASASIDYRQTAAH